MLTHLNLGSLYQIPVKIHWTFFLLPIALGTQMIWENNSIHEIISMAIYVGCLFCFVIMHEFGHALTAKMFHIKTFDILITPIGGLARLHHLPSKPSSTIAITLAGPLVNLALATIIMLIMMILEFDHYFPIYYTVDVFYSPTDFVRYLFIVNLVLFFFNLIPAYPMDGGRIVMALLKFYFSPKISRLITGVLAIFIAFIFVYLGFYYGNINTLSIIGIFIIYMTYIEYRDLKKSQTPCP